METINYLVEITLRIFGVIVLCGVLIYVLVYIYSTVFVLVSKKIGVELPRIKRSTHNAKKLKTTYEEKKIAASILVDERAFNKMSANIIKDVENHLKIQMIAFVNERAVDERNLEYEFENPTFLDWLMRRKRKVTVNFKASDILLEAPKDYCARIYDVKIKN
jgi:hypothetical protein